MCEHRSQGIFYFFLTDNEHRAKTETQGHREWEIHHRHFHHLYAFNVIFIVSYWVFVVFFLQTLIFPTLCHWLSGWQEQFHKIF